MQYMTQISERGHNPCQLWPPHVGLPQQPKSTSEDGSDGKVGVGSTQRAVHDRHRPSTSHYTSTISYLKVVSTARWIQPRRPFAGDTSKKVYKIPWKTIFSLTLEGAKRTIGKPPSQQKEPLSADMAKQVIDKFGKSDNLVHRRTALICLLGFSGFMRISELIAVQVKHLQFKPGHLEIFVPKAKNDQHREGHLIHIKKIEPAYCPVLALTQYLELTGLDKNEENYIISRLSKTKNGHNAHCGKPLADSSVRDIFNRDVAPICCENEPGEYSLHSLRS